MDTDPGVGVVVLHYPLDGVLGGDTVYIGTKTGADHITLGCMEADYKISRHYPVRISHSLEDILTLGKDHINPFAVYLIITRLQFFKTG